MAKLKKEYEFPLYIFHSGKNYKAVHLLSEFGLPTLKPFRL